MIAFKVGNDTESIVNAGQRFLSDQDQMSVLTGRIFAGHLRSIIGSMTVEEIVTERQKLATEVLDTSKAEMAKIGLIVDSLQIQSIDDGDTGYIEAMSAPHKAAIQRQAQIAQAQATQASVEAEQEAARNQAEYAAADRRRPGGVLGRGRPRPGQGRPGRAARRRRTPSRRCSTPRPNWPSARPSCASSSWSPRSSSPPRPRPSGSGCSPLAEAERMKIQAEAAASYDRVALDRMLIDQLPQIVKEAAGGLAGANVNVLNGADGLGEIAAGLVGQGLTILDSVRQNLGTPGNGKAPERTTPATPRAPQQRTGPDDGPVAIP